jgi:hypothetical protein
MHVHMYEAKAMKGLGKASSVIILRNNYCLQHISERTHSEFSSWLPSYVCVWEKKFTLDIS